MSSKVKLVKKVATDHTKRVAAKSKLVSEQQRNRELVEVIKSWIDEFRLQTESKSQDALALLVK